MTDNITGKAVVITGASSGMGAAAARHLAGKGAAVVLGARRTDRIDALVAEITEAGGKAIAVATDVTKRDDLQRLVAAAVETYGRIDVLINNAGVMPLSPLERVKVDEWDQMIDVNLKGVLYGVAAALPHMIAQKSGHIINVSSVAGHKLFGGSAVYSATKFAVRALSEGLRQEMAPHNIRTTIISPGAVKTDSSITSARRTSKRPTRIMWVRSAYLPKPWPGWSPSPSMNPRTLGSTRSCFGRRLRNSKSSAAACRVIARSPGNSGQKEAGKSYGFGSAYLLRSAMRGGRTSISQKRHQRTMSCRPEADIRKVLERTALNSAYQSHFEAR